MSSSVTPQRRRRADDDEDVELDDTATSPTNKRPRLDEEQSDDEDTESPDRPLFPDSYRRSPKGKGRARDSATSGMLQGYDEQEHKPGAIVRVTLRDFVTYTNAEFHPGPNLNMVIGPNGTGKSTLVCAICIGLGWSTSHLGRAKDLAEFVKHGKKSAEIEIELKADPARHSQNPIITHRINRDGSSKSGTQKSVFMINGKKSSAKGVQDLAKSFSVQVDNLCQFLPQDRVVEFAALNPVELLVQTQKAAAPDQMSEWHEQLKQMHKEQVQKERDQTDVNDQLQRMEERQRAQEIEVDRLRERELLQKKLATFEKIRLYADYVLAKNEHEQAKEQKTVALQELAALEQRMQPNFQAVEDKKEYLSQVEKLIKHRKSVLTRLEQDAERKHNAYKGTASSLEETGKELDAEKAGGQKDKASIISHQNQIRQTENALKNPPASFNSVEMNKQIADKRTESRKIEDEKSNILSEMQSLEVQAKQRNRMIEEAENKRTFLQSQAGKQASKLDSVSQDAGKAWRWIQGNRDRFSSPVYGPPLIECTVKDPRTDANAAEALIGNSELVAFTVTSQDDYKMLDHQLLRVMKLRDIYIRTSTRDLATFRPPCSDDQLKQIGFDGWMLDRIDGPDAVLAMLCDNRNVHQTAFTCKDNRSIRDDLLEGSNISSYIAGDFITRITRRREYNISSSFTRPIQQARHFNNAPVNTQQEQDLAGRITEWKGELAHILEERKGLDTRRRALDTQIKEIEKDRKAIEDEKNEKQRQQSQYDGLEEKLESQKRKLADVQERVQNQRLRIQAIRDKQDDLALLMAPQALAYATALDTTRKNHEQVLVAQIMQIEARSDIEQLEARNAEERDLLERKSVEVRTLDATERELKRRARALHNQCAQLTQELTDEEGVEQQRLEAQNFDKEWLENEIAAAQARLETLHGGNANLIQEYEKREQNIQKLRKRLRSVQEETTKLADKITETRQQWEPQLDELVSRISDAFAENFSRIQCAGEVAVYKDEDFAQWAVQIKVKFRENEQLSILDSHRQSGGERAVSTIFYLMALQSLARAPFRVVDEINQGMDPRNERLVHSRMVEIACAEHTSQYFLITPKLLSNLTYHPNMKVHCIASGEYMPEDHKTLDFEMLAQKALTIRSGAA